MDVKNQNNAENSATIETVKDNSVDQEEVENKKEEWEVQRDALKGKGDAAFRTKAFPEAIQHYSDALSLDPMNHILLSNRSASYLSNKEKSRALDDARECIKHAPIGFRAKAHGRLGAALMSLGRYSEARKTYESILKTMDANNVTAKKAVEDCQAHSIAIRKTEMELLARQKLHKEELERKKEEEKKKREEEEEKLRKEQTQTNSNEDQDDLLDDFFSEVENVTSNEPATVAEDIGSKNDESNESRDDSKSDKDNQDGNKIQIQLSELGTSEDQINRLLAHNYEWKNLNPFSVLAISHLAPINIISQRYKALSLLVHPDKCQHEKAKDAFEELRKAMSSLKDEQKRKHLKALVESGFEQGKRDYEKNSNAMNNITLEKAKEIAVMKIFASIEQSRREVERRKRSHEQRERDQEDEEKNRMKNERNFEKKWRDENRVEKRIGNWRDFNSNGKKHKAK